VFNYLLSLKAKHKKRHMEAERHMEVMTSNLILLRHLAEIAVSKRVNDGNEPKKVGNLFFYN